MISRRPALRLALGLSLVSLSLTGCSDQAALEQRAIRQQVDAAIDLVHEAHRGIVPSGEAEAVMPMQYREGRLTEAAQKLQPLTAAGPDAQRAAVMRLLSEVQSGRALILLRRTVDRNAELARQNAELVSLLAGVQQSDNDTASLGTDAAPALATLTASRAEVAGDRESAAGQRDRLTAESTRLGQEIAAQKSRQAAAEARARSLSDKAFLSAGEQKLKLSVESVQARRQADQAAAEVERLSLQQATLDNELTLVQSRLQAIDARDAALARQIESINTTQGTLADLAQRAATARAESAVVLRTAVESAVALFDKDVAQPMAQVIQLLEDARQQADTAAGLLAGADQAGAELDTLARRVEKINAQVHLVAARADLAHSLKAVSDGLQGRAIQNAAFFSEQADRAGQARTALIAETLPTLDEAASAADRLSSGGDDADPQAKAARTFKAELTAYKQRLNAFKR